MTPGDLETGERLLTSDEAAAVAGVAKAAYWHRMVARGSAPKPDGHVGRTPVWRESTVEQWRARRG